MILLNFLVVREILLNLYGDNRWITDIPTMSAQEIDVSRHYGSSCIFLLRFVRVYFYRCIICFFAILVLIDHYV